MKFDTVIIGGGLAGLMCGISLSKKGQRCVIVSSGQSALHFSSGSFDLLNCLPDGTVVENPVRDVSRLIEKYPEHPYSKIGKEDFAKYADLIPEMFRSMDVKVRGNSSKNHFRVTPMGVRRPTWLTTSDFIALDSETELPWKKVALYNVAGFLDFYPSFIADEFAKMGAKCEIHSVNFTELDTLRRNPSEIRSTNIARVIDSHLDKLVSILGNAGDDCEAILLPAVFGIHNTDVTAYLTAKIGKQILLLSTMPPTVMGIRTQQKLQNYFRSLGGVYMLGDHALRADLDGNRVVRLYSENHGNIPFTGKNYVLATGSFFSNGLMSTQERVYEPVFGLDVTYLKNRSEWYNRNIFEKQAYQEFGVKTDNRFRAIKDGMTFENLYAAGAVLDGFNPIKEGCGAGVSILSALCVADQIMENR